MYVYHGNVESVEVEDSQLEERSSNEKAFDSSLSEITVSRILPYLKDSPYMDGYGPCIELQLLRRRTSREQAAAFFHL